MTPLCKLALQQVWARCVCSEHPGPDAQLRVKVRSVKSGLLSHGTVDFVLF